MKPKRIICTVLTLLPFSLFAQGDEPDVSGELFQHVLDSKTLDLFPFLPPLHLFRGMTVHLLMLLLSAALIFILFAIAFRKPSLKPRGLAVVLEILILFVRDDIVFPIMGKQRGEKWLPFFSTLFLFLLTVNFLGLIPAFKTATGDITVTSALALLILILMFVVGFKSIGFGKFFKNLYPEGIPLPLGLFVSLLEFFGMFIKSLVLSLRIFANMFAGHMAILSFLMLTIVLNPAFGVVSVPFALFTYILEVIVALIQALVFTLLSCVFITMASSAHDDSVTQENKE